LLEGNLQKMRVALDSPVRYELPVGEELLPLNDKIGQRIQLVYSGAIHCTHCGRKSKKSFSQGYCYPCFKALAQCDNCIVSPEKCHYDAGTCREPEWGETFCMQDHFVYLANSSGVKVGITRGTQIPTRWIDQGAIQALPIARVSTRRQSGLMEVILKQLVADKTNWRAMLKGDVHPMNLAEARDDLFERCRDELDALQQEHGLQSMTFIDDGEQVDITYPVTEYPTKIVSLNLDKTPVVEGTLMGIKGQYLIFDTGVINIRKYTGYEVTVA